MKSKAAFLILMASLTLAGKQAKFRPYWAFWSRKVMPSDIYRLELSGLRMRTYSRWLNALSFEVPQDRTSVLTAYPGVIRTEKVKSARVEEASRPMDVNSIQYSDDDYGLSLDQLAPMRVPEAHQKGYLGSDVPVAIFDTGFDSLHPAVEHLFRNGNILRTHDFNSGDHMLVTGSYGPPPFPEEGVFYVNSYSVASLDTFYVIMYSIASDEDLGGYGLSNAWSIFYITGSEYDGTIYWNDSPVNVVPGDTFALQPYCQLRDDTVYAVWQMSVSGNDFDVFFARMKAGEEPINSVNVSGDLYPSLDPVMFLKGDTVSVLWLDPQRGLVASFSEDRGESFSAGQVVYSCAGAPGGLVSGGQGPYYLLFSMGDSLYFGKSGDALSWNVRAVGAGTLPDLLVAGDTLHIIYDVESADDFDVYYAFSPDGGASWSDPELLVSTSYPSSQALHFEDGVLKLAYSDHGVLLDMRVEDGRKDTVSYIFSDLPQRAGSHLAWRRRGDDSVYPDNFVRHHVFMNPTYHGTKMLSVIGGFNPRELIGVAPDADFLLAKTERVYTTSGIGFENQIEEDFWVEALEWATDAGAKIVSSSLGYRDWYSVEDLDGETPVSSRAASMALSRGVLVVSAMGNEVHSHFPDPSVGDTTLVPPADAEDIIAAGAYVVDSLTGELIPKGSYGPAADGRVKPELIAPYWAYAAVDTIFSDGDSANVYFWTFGGTSYSTALIAGVAALVLQAHPDWSAEKLRDVLLTTAQPVDVPGYPDAPVPNNVTGHGLPDAMGAIEYENPIVPSAEEDVVLYTPFPNPLNLGETTVLHFPYSLKYSTLGTLKIFSASGKLVLTKDFDEIHVGRGELIVDFSQDRGELPAPGLYFALLSTGFGSAKTKFAVVK